MSTVIAVSTGKGGVGKSTAACHLAARLAAAPRNGGVLLVDLDPQRNATRRLLAPEDLDGPGLAEVLTGSIPVTDAIATSRVSNDLDVLRAGSGLQEAARLIGAAKSRETVLQRMVVDPARGVWRWIILDLPPDLGDLTVNGLTAADSVLSPVLCDGDSFAGVMSVLEVLAELKEAGLNPATHAGSVIIATEPGPAYAVTLEALKAANVPVLGEWRRGKAWLSSQAAGILVWEYQNKGKNQTETIAAVDKVVTALKRKTKGRINNGA